MQPRMRLQSGFKPKKKEDLTSVTFDDIDKYADLFYEEKYEDKIQGARNLLYLLIQKECMLTIPEEKQNLFDIMSRTLREEHKKSMELTIVLLAFFCSYSYYPRFHQLLMSQSLGEICLSIIDFQFIKYEIRRDEMIRFSMSDKISKAEYQQQLDKFLFLVRKQDRIIRLAFLILIHLAEEPKVEMKMVKKDIIKTLMNQLERKEINFLLIILLFLKRLSVIQSNKDTMIKAGILDKLMNIFQINQPNVLQLNIKLIYNLSFDHKFRSKIIEKKDYFFTLTELFKKRKLRSGILRVLYNLSLEEKSMPLFWKSDTLFIVYELLSKFPQKLIGVEIAALALNLVSNTNNANKIGEDDRAQNLITRALKNSDYDLIRIVKNIIKFTDQEKIIDIFDEFVDSKFIPIILSRTETQEFQIEIIEILSFIKTDWLSRVKAFKLIEYFEKNLEIKYDEMLVAVLSFIWNIASDMECGKLLAKSKIISMLISCLSKDDNEAIVFAILNIFYLLMGNEHGKKSILKNEKLIKTIMSYLKGDSEKVKHISICILQVVELHEEKWSEQIREINFLMHNNKLIKRIELLFQQNLMNPREDEEYFDDDYDQMKEDFGNYEEDNLYGGQF